jgi:hypothetical protein
MKFDNFFFKVLLVQKGSNPKKGKSLLHEEKKRKKMKEK